MSFIEKAVLVITVIALVGACTERRAPLDGGAPDSAIDGGGALDASTDASVACDAAGLHCELQECWLFARAYCDSTGPFCGPASVRPQGTLCAGGEGVCNRGRLVENAWLLGVVAQNAQCELTHQRSCRGEVINSGGCGFLRCPAGTLCGAVIGGDETFDLGSADAIGAEPILTGVHVGMLEMDRMEVNVARFRAFWNATDRVPTEAIMYPDGREIIWAGELREPIEREDTDDVHNWSPVAAVDSREGHPVNGVDWWTALAFCVWDGGRLPTEAEWEYFARVRENDELLLRRGRTYAWGSARTESDGDCHQGIYEGCRFTAAEPWPHSESVYALEHSEPLHMSGNVAEWTADAFRPYSDACWAAFDRNDPWCAPATDDVSGERTIRGGSYLSPEPLVRGASRVGAAALTQSSEIGFRCIREPR